MALRRHLLLWIVGWDPLVELDEDEHGGVCMAPAYHGTFSWTVELVSPLYRANMGNEALSRFLGSLLGMCGLCRCDGPDG